MNLQKSPFLTGHSLSCHVGNAGVQHSIICVSSVARCSEPNNATRFAALTSLVEAPTSANLPIFRQRGQIASTEFEPKYPPASKHCSVDWQKSQHDPASAKYEKRIGSEKYWKVVIGLIIAGVSGPGHRANHEAPHEFHRVRHHAAVM